MDTRRHLATNTGLYAFDVFEVLLNYEIARIKRYPSPITLIHLTLASEGVSEEFKKQAHEAMTSLLNRTLRVSDVPGHYQEDFLILLPSTEEAGAKAVAERILASYRTTQSLATGRLSTKRNAYLGLTSRNGGSVLSPQQLQTEAASAMNEARKRKSYTFVSFAELTKKPTEP